MYRLFTRIPKGLDPVADSFRRHVEADGLALVKEATEAAAAKAAAGALIALLEMLEDGRLCLYTRHAMFRR